MGAQAIDTKEKNASELEHCDNFEKPRYSRKRLLGAYYSPEKIADVLVHWAMNNKLGTILDPSFGGCVFLEAASRYLKQISCRDVSTYIYGVDIDSTCVGHFSDSKEQLSKNNCLRKDFLSVEAQDLTGFPFDAVVGNPPYVRHHWISSEQKESLKKIGKSTGVPISQMASLWVYFVLHSLSFLRIGGRMAMLVPEAILQADYAMPVRKILAQNFRRVQLIYLSERLFKSTNEAVVVISGEDFGTCGSCDVYSVDSITKLTDVLNERYPSDSMQTLTNGRRVHPNSVEVMNKVIAGREVLNFRDIAKTRIGIVTGANNHFLKSREEIISLNLPSSSYYEIVSRTNWLNGIEYIQEDHESAANSGRNAFLVNPSKSHFDHPGVQRWINQGVDLRVNEGFKCKERDLWYSIPLSNPPDAFISATRVGSPIFVVNKTSCYCTNTIYTVEMYEPRKTSIKALALSFLTTYTALWSEINGRRYGGGILKLDLGALSLIKLPIVKCTESDYDAANYALRSGNERLARDIADKVVLQDGFGLSKYEIDQMKKSLYSLHNQRLPKRME